MSGMFPNEHVIDIFGEQVKWPGLDPDGKFTNGSFTDPQVKPSFIPAETLNLLVGNMQQVIEAAGLNPNNIEGNQLAKAIKSLDETFLSGNIPFNTGWTDVNNSGRYYRKTPNGFVFFSVYAEKSTPIVAGDAIFTLPSGFMSSGGSAIFPAWFSRLTSTETGFGALKLQSGTISVHSVPTINSTGVCALVSYFAVD